MQFAEAKLGRVFIIRLHDGDRLPSALEEFALDRNLKSAFCVFLGGAKGNGRVIVGPEEDTFPPKPIVRLLDGVHEICAVGTIFCNDEGKPKLHMHASLGRGGKVVTGCVRLGLDIWQIGEAILLELVGTDAHREIDPKTGFELLAL